MLVMPGHQQPPANQIINLLFLRTQPGADRHRGGNDGVMIADLAIIDKARAQWPLPAARCQPGAIGFFNRCDHGRQRTGDCHGQVAAIGARITDQLVLLIKRLGDIQRGLRAEAIQAVGVALQFGEVIQQRRCGAPGFGTARFDHRPTLPGAGHDAFRLLAIGRQALGLGLWARAAKPGTGVGQGVLRFRRENRHHFPILLGDKGANRQLAFDYHRQGGRLHPPD